MKDTNHPGIIQMIKTRKAQVKAEKRIIQDNNPQLWIVPEKYVYEAKDGLVAMRFEAQK